MGRLGARRRPHPLSPSPPAERGSSDEVPWGTSPELWERQKPLARQMRRNPTAAEAAVWERLRNRRLFGSRFRRQHAIDRFLVDFYCAEARLVVEIDGPVHQYSRQEDAIRQELLESRGLRVLRFTNEEVGNNIDGVLERIATALQFPSPRAERGQG